MGNTVTDLMVANALGLAEQHLRAEGRIVPMFYFSGPGGEAVLRLDLTPEKDRADLFQKARLMAAALAAEACAWVCEARLEEPGEPAQSFVAIFCESRGGDAALFAHANGTGADACLVPFDSPLTRTAGGDGPSPLSAYIHRAAGESDPGEAWRRLEAMGVSRSDSRRALN